jgi:hypothetical protein
MTAENPERMHTKLYPFAGVAYQASVDSTHFMRGFGRAAWAMNTLDESLRS